MKYQVGDIIRCERCARGAEITSVEGTKVEFKLLDKGFMPGLCSCCSRFYCSVCMLEANNKCPNCAAKGSFNLLGKLVSINTSISPSDANGWVAICDLCKSDRYTEIALALDKFPELITRKDENGSTLLHTAALCDALATSTLLLDRGAEIDAGDNKGNTPLMCAIFADHERLVQLFLCRGANVQAVARNGASVIFHAASKRKANLVTELLKYGAPVDQCGRLVFDEMTLSITPLQVAVINGDTELVGILARAGADVNYGDPTFGFTPTIMALLEISKGNGSVEIIRELHRHGADLNLADREGNNTPLSLAKKFNLTDAADTLRELGVKDPGGCFIASAVYENEHVIEIAHIRRWRDERVAKYSLGRFLIIWYKVVGPKLASLVQLGLIPRRPLRWMFDRLAARISKM